MEPIRGFFTFIHHTGPLIEWSDNIEKRREVIRTTKPEAERTTRLRCLVRVPEERVPALYAAQAEYERVKGPAWAEYERVEGLAWAEYLRVEGLARAEYARVRGPAWAEYLRVVRPARAKYLRVKDSVLSDPETLSLVRELIPDCPWDGQTILARVKEA